MPFLSHLEELRWHLLRAAVALIVVFGVVFSNIRWVMDHIILAPLRPDFITYRVLLCPVSPALCPNAKDMTLSLQLLSPTEAFTRALLIGFVGAFVVCFPYLLWELWRFVRPGLRHHELRHVKWVVLPVSLLFFVGVAFAYFVVAPFSLAFFVNFTLTDLAVQQWRVGPTVSLIVQICFAGGLLFQMPVVAWVLARLGVLRAAWLRQRRRHAIVVILIAAAVLTPADIFSMILLAVPMLLLFEVSIWVVAAVERRQRRLAKRAEKAAAQNPPPPPPPSAGPDDTPPPPTQPSPPLPDDARDPHDYDDTPQVLPPEHSLPQHRRD